LFVEGKNASSRIIFRSITVGKLVYATYNSGAIKNSQMGQRRALSSRRVVFMESTATVDTFMEQNNAKAIN
jgi:hypothetical protein